MNSAAFQMACAEETHARFSTDAPPRQAEGETLSACGFPVIPALPAFPESADDTRLRIAGYDDDGIADGPGLRSVIFVQGCPHHCPGCHNPQTWDFGEDKGRCETVLSLYNRIRSNPLTTGVTFSGGEPFAQARALAVLARKLRPNYDIAVYTGYTWEGLMSLSKNHPEVIELLEQVDIVVDGPFVQARADRLLLFRGSVNQRILDAQKSLASGTATWTTDLDWIGLDGSSRAWG